MLMTKTPTAASIIDIKIGKKMREGDAEREREGEQWRKAKIKFSKSTN